MKIALYAGTYVKDKDGAVRSIYQLVASFRKNGHEVMVWSSDVSGQDNHGSLKVNRLPSVPIPLYPDYKLGFFNAVTKRQLDAYAPDIVHISTPDIVGRRFLLYAKKRSFRRHRFIIPIFLLTSVITGWDLLLDRYGST